MRVALNMLTTNTKQPSQTTATVLVVDDVAVNLELVSSVLKSDYRVLVANHGARALAVAREQSPELILLDIMMPDIDGHEVCRRLKADPTTSSIPVIFLTTKTDSADIEKGFALGAVDYITKPIDLPVLQARVATHVQLRQSKLQLEQQVRVLQENARLKESVEMMVRHDMRNPLSAIVMQLSLIKEKPELASYRENCSIIEKASRRLLHMLNNSINLYKIEQGRFRFQPTNVSLQELLQDVLDDKAPQLLLHQLDLHNEAPSKAVYVRADRLLLYTVVANLLQNAIEASEEGGIVKVIIVEQSKLGVLSIENSGVIPADIRDTVFEKYVTSGKEQGTGLGTYSAMLLTRAQQGDLSYQTLKQARTRFTVSLPLGDSLE